MKQNNSLTESTCSQDSTSLLTAKNSKSTETSRLKLSSAKDNKKSAKQEPKDITSPFSNSIFELSLNNLLGLIKKLRIENKQLKEECNEKTEQLIENADTIKELQRECSANHTQLEEETNLIERLQADSEEMKESLDIAENAIEKLEAKCEVKDWKLIRSERRIKQLESACEEHSSQALESLKRLKHLGNNMHHAQFLLQASKECMKECCDQQQNVEGLVHANNSIHIVTLTCKNPKTLAYLHSWRALFLLKLNEHQRSIDASTQALHYQSNYNVALYNRALVYSKLGQHKNARQDLEKLLRLNPNYDGAQDLLDIVREHINKASQR